MIQKEKHEEDEKMNAEFAKMLDDEAKALAEKERQQREEE